MLDGMEKTIGRRKILTQMALEAEHYDILKKYSDESMIPMAVIVRTALTNHLVDLKLIAGPKSKLGRV